MESELKELLRERAERAGIDPAIPAQVIRRARTRRRRTVAVAGVLTVALVAGSMVGVRALLQIEPPTKPAAGAWPGIWPQDTRAEAVKAQRQAYELATSRGLCAGQPGTECEDQILWQLDKGEVATRYAVQALGWPDASTSTDMEPDAAGPVTVGVDSCPPPGVGCRAVYRATVTLERLLRPDRFGLWFVTGADQVITPTAAESVVFRFLDARLDEASVDDLIAPAAREIYSSGEAGLSLYGGDAGPFVGYEVEDRDPGGEDTFLFLVRVHRADTTVAESLLVGPGSDSNGNPKPVVVLSVSRVEYREIDETVPPPNEEQSQTTEEEVFELATFFMEARLAGSGAEDYLATQTLMAYESHEQLWQPDESGLYLYGDPHPQGDPANAYVAYRIEEIRPADASTCSWFSEAACQDAWEVVVVTELDPVDGGQPGIMQELLLVAPADGAAAEFADWMISGAARGPEPPS
jgi:hypothetical protein